VGAQFSYVIFVLCVFFPRGFALFCNSFRCLCCFAVLLFAAFVVVPPGYYAKYLRPWVAAFGSGRGNLFVVDFDELEASAPQVMATVATWLGLAPFAFTAQEVYNSRQNRGVHSTEGKTGGKISGVAKADLGALALWSAGLPPDVAATLTAYFAKPNAELRALLGPTRAMAWTAAPAAAGAAPAVLLRPS
jgi:hypothetical protein